MKIYLIGNPVSGGNALPCIDRSAAWLESHEADVEVHLTGQRGDARQLAAGARGWCDRVVVAGGDGTLCEVASALQGSGLPVAFIPLGTVNVFALETGIPRELEAACRLARYGRPQPISLGRIGDDAFLLMASAGWDAAAVARVRPQLKRRFGRLAYVVSAAEALLRHRPTQLMITLPDGSSRSGFGVVASNARCYGGRYVVTPQASLASPRLAVGLLRRTGRPAMLGMALRVAMRRRLPPAYIEYFQVEELAIAGAGVPVQIDGDAWGMLPVRIACLPQALTVVLPDLFRAGDHD